MLGILLLAAAPQAMQAESLEAIADRLSAASPYTAGARYEVLLPQSEDPVAYDIAINAYATPADTLSPCAYLIDWSFNTPSGPSSGFNAYFDGHHYRYRDKRMQEYHADDSAAPFSASGSVRRGVQQQAQFADILPAFIAQRLRDMASDSSYTYTITTDPQRATTTVSGVQRYGGVDGLEFKYVFSSTSGLPVSAEFCHNPGHMSEQTVTVAYTSPDLNAQEGPYSEPLLMSLYPEAFTRYRQSTYTLQNLPGRPLPDISAPTLSGGRYTHSVGQPFATPTVLAILDPDVESTPEIISALRDAIAGAPAAATLLLAFDTKHPDAITAITGNPGPDETILTRASAIARDCGATALPVVIVCDRQGNVKNIHTGRNKDLAAIVMQEITLAN